MELFIFILFNLENVLLFLAEKTGSLAKNYYIIHFNLVVNIVLPIYIIDKLQQFVRRRII